MHAMTHAPSAPARQRWMFLAVLLTIAALILSACGAKIETQLGLELSLIHISEPTRPY